MRTATNWLTHVFLSTRATEQDREDAADWLNGHDDAIRERRNRRDFAAVIAGGGEIG